VARDHADGTCVRRLHHSTATMNATATRSAVDSRRRKSPTAEQHADAHRASADPTTSRIASSTNLR
jgi:hypothetical protein